MSDDPWTVVEIEKSFSDRIENKYTEISLGLDIASNPPVNVALARKLCSGYSDTEEFRKRCDELYEIIIKSGPDIAIMKLEDTFPGVSRMRNFYVMKLSGWCGYFHLNRSEKVFTALLAIEHYEAKPLSLAKTLLDLLGKQRNVYLARDS